MALNKANGPKGALKKEVVSLWESKEVESKQRWAERAQRKELVNGVGSKANKPKSKGYGNWVGEAQKI